MAEVNLATTPRQKIIISSSLTALVTLALIAFVTWPSLVEIKRLSGEIDAQRAELEALYQRGQGLKETLQAYNEVKPTVAALDRIYVKRGEELAFITSLEKTADSSQVEQAIKLTPVNESSSVQPLPLQLDLVTDLNRLIKYLGGLEALDYYVNFDTVRLGNPGRDAAKTTALTTLLIGTSFIRP